MLLACGPLAAAAAPDSPQVWGHRRAESAAQAWHRPPLNSRPPPPLPTGMGLSGRATFRKRWPVAGPGSRKAARRRRRRLRRSGDRRGSCLRPGPGALLCQGPQGPARSGPLEPGERQAVRVLCVSAVSGESASRAGHCAPPACLPACLGQRSEREGSSSHTGGRKPSLGFSQPASVPSVIHSRRRTAAAPSSGGPSGPLQGEPPTRGSEDAQRVAWEATHCWRGSARQWSPACVRRIQGSNRKRGRAGRRRGRCGRGRCPCRGCGFRRGRGPLAPPTQAREAGELFQANVQLEWALQRGQLLLEGCAGEAEGLPLVGWPSAGAGARGTQNRRRSGFCWWSCGNSGSPPPRV